MQASPRDPLIIALALLSMQGVFRSAEAQTTPLPGYPVETGLLQRAFVQPVSAGVFRGSLLPPDPGDGTGAPLFPLPYTLEDPLADSTGTAATLFAGQRDLTGGSFRHAGRVGSASRLEASGHYLRGNDWPFADPVEERLRETSALIPPRDDGTERWGGELRYGLRQGGAARWDFAAGFDRMRGNQLTEVGAAYARHWSRWYGHTRFRQGSLSAEATVRGRGAGEAAFYRTARPIEDQSLVFAGRVSHSTVLSDRQAIAYTAFAFNARPSTSGTVTGVYEDADDIQFAGGSLSSTTRLTRSLDLQAGVSVVNHSRVDEPILAPRAALILRPMAGHRLQASYSRDLLAPSSDNFVMDVTAGRINAGALIYDVLARGVPTSGFTFNDRCAGGFQDLCMRSPLAPGEQLPADPTVLWNTLVDIAAATDPLALRPLRVFFRDPEPGELRPLLFLYNQKESEAGRPPFLGEGALGHPIEVRPIDPLQPTIFDTQALEYRGEAGDRGVISAGIWRSTIDNFIGPLRSETPTVFFDPASVRAFLERRVVPMVRLGLVPPELAGLMVHDLTNLASQIPVGTIMPDQVTTPGLLLTYRNYGTVELWGANLSAEVSLTPDLSLQGSYAYVSEECFDFVADMPSDCSGRDDISLNVPKTKSSFSLRYRDPDSGFSADTRLRRLRGFYANAGVYAGDVEGYAVLDASIHLPIPRLSRASVGIAASNLLNDRHQEFIGAPEIGRLLVAKLTYAFR